MGASTSTLTGVLKGNLHVTPKGLLDREIIKSVYIDSTLVTLAATTQYKLIHLEADALVMGGYLVTVVAEGAGDTIEVGDATADHTWLGATSLNSNDTLTAFTGNPLYYAAANEICVYFSAAITVAKFWVIVKMIQLSKV